MIGKVKRRLEYDLWETRDPEPTDNSTQGYVEGVTWLNELTGSSFQFVDDAWREIDIGLNRKAAVKFSESLYLAVRAISGGSFGSCPYFVKRRDLGNISINYPEMAIFRGGDSLDGVWARRHLVMYQSWASDAAVFTQNGDLTEITGAIDRSSGSLSGFRAPGYVLIQGTLNNDGIYPALSNDSEILIIGAMLTEGEDEAFISYLHLPEPLLNDVGGMAWFDLFFRNKNIDLKNERVGSYSWTKANMKSVGGMTYPPDLIPFISTQRMVTAI